MIFKNVQVLIYVFDVEKEGKELEDDMRDYKLGIQTLSNYSPNSTVFILIHKMDKIRESEREEVLERKK